MERSQQIGTQVGDLISRLSRPSGPRFYRLIDAGCEPHRHLDGNYDSLEEALIDATAWLQGQGADPLIALVGVDVSTTSGDWRTLRLPAPLPCACPLVLKP